MIFNKQQLSTLQTLEEKWTVWNKTQVSLFTHSDKLKLDEVRATMGLQPCDIACYSCFIDDISAVMNIYDQQKQSDETPRQGEAKGSTTRRKRKPKLITKR